MAAAHAKVAELSDQDRRTLEGWLLEFGRLWNEHALAARVRQLPPPGNPLRLPALVEMVKIDLERQWQLGRPARIEAYLKFYPELGTADTVPANLIQAEYEARRRSNATVPLADFEKRFPRQADTLRLLVEQAEAEASDGDLTRHTHATSAATAPGSRPPGAPGELPEQFGRYRVLNQLGHGGMGAVYLAHDSQLERQVALKVPYFTVSDGPEVLERFYREARSAATIAHPNICPVYEVGQVEGIHYLAMAYLEGKPLSAYLQKGKGLPQNKVAAIVRRLALALQEAHERGVIHRDLKPSNIMVNKRGEPVIMDFGLARHFDKEDARLTRPGAMMGTPAYMPPEQVTGDVAAMGPGCDIYSLGVILYELLTGQVPFQGPATALVVQVLTRQPVPPCSLRPDLDPRMQAICLKAMAKKIEDRYATMTQMAAALADYLRTRDHGAAGQAVQAAQAAHAAPGDVLLVVEEVNDILPVLPVEKEVAEVVEVLPGPAGKPPPAPPDRPSSKPAHPGAKPPAAHPVVLITERTAPIAPPPPARPSGKNLPQVAIVAKPVAIPVQPRRPALATPNARTGSRPPASESGGVGCLLLKLAAGAFFLFLVVAAGGWALYYFTLSADSSYKKGQELARKGDYTGAIAQYTKALDSNDKHFDAYCGRSEAYFRKSEYNLAINDCTRAIQLNGTSARAYCYRGGSYNRIGEFDRALADCNEAIRLDPGLALAHAFRGDTYGNMADYAQALQDLNKAVALDPKLALAYAYRSDVHGDMGKLVLAIEDCNTALEYDSQLGPAYAYRGAFHARKRKYDLALKDFDRAIQLAPNDAEVYNCRGVAHSSKDDLKTDDLASALADYDKAIDLAPRFSEFYSNRAQVYILKKDLRKAKEDTTRAIDLSPRSASAHYARAKVYYYENNATQAVADLTEAIRQNPKCYNAYHLLGLIHSERGQNKEAIDQLSRAIAIEPDTANGSYLERGRIHLARKDHALALADFTKAIEINPDYPRAYIDRATAYNLNKEPDKAIADCTKALKYKLPNNTTNYDAYFWLGYAHLEKTQYGPAIDAFDQALRFNPKSAPAHFNRGLAHLRRSASAQAISDFEKAIALDPKNERIGDYYFQLSKSYQQIGNVTKAREHYDTAVRNKPSLASNPRP